MKNVASLSWLQVITYLLPIIIRPYLFRTIGAEKLGLLTNNTLTGFYCRKNCQCRLDISLTAFSQAIFPRLSKMFHKNKMLALKIMQQIQLITIIISLIFLPLIFIFADFVVKAICGKDYPTTVLSLRLLLVSVFFINSNAFRVQFLLVAGKTHTYSNIHIMMAMIGLPLIFLLIYSYSYIEAGIFTMTYFAVRKLTFQMEPTVKAVAPSK